MAQIPELVLASESPRRKDLLARAGFSFQIFSVQVSEILEKNLTDTLSMNDQILTIARRKAEASLRSYKNPKHQNFLILAADTMVILNGTALGKPRSTEEAFQFLKSLSGKSHEVKTAVVLAQGPAVTLKDSTKISERVETTTVIFRPLSDREIREYIESGEPMDKAGAYGIQGMGGAFVEKIVGSFDNVVGLPVDAVKKMMHEFA